MEGKCPKCQKENLTYGNSLLDYNSIGYEFICNGCNVKGIEWFTLVYSKSIIKR